MLHVVLGKVICQQSNLKRHKGNAHEEIHKGVRFQCDECDVPCSQKDALRLHKKRFHSDADNISEVFKCNHELLNLLLLF